jgi:hypothetical protein
MNVGKMMTRQVWTCGLNDSLNTAARLMWDNDCGSILVVDAEGKSRARFRGSVRGTARACQRPLSEQLPLPGTPTTNVGLYDITLELSRPLRGRGVAALCSHACGPAESASSGTAFMSTSERILHAERSAPWVLVEHIT